MCVTLAPFLGQIYLYLMFLVHRINSGQAGAWPTNLWQHDFFNTTGRWHRPHSCPCRQQKHTHLEVMSYMCVTLAPFLGQIYLYLMFLVHRVNSGQAGAWSTNLWQHDFFNTTGRWHRPHSCPCRQQKHTHLEVMSYMCVTLAPFLGQIYLYLMFLVHRVNSGQAGAWSTNLRQHDFFNTTGRWHGVRSWNYNTWHWNGSSQDTGHAIMRKER